MSRRLGAVLTLSLVSTLLVAAGTSPAQAATFAASAGTATPLVGENVKISGGVTPAGRVVQLQVARGGKWVGVANARTTSRSAYAFTVRAASTKAVYRVYAPTSGRSGARSSNSLGVTGVAPVLNLGAPVFADHGGTLAPAVAMYSPARPGTAVSLSKKVGSTWTTVGTGSQDAAGVVRFGFVSAGTADAPVTYRAQASPGNGAPVTTSMAVVSMRARRQVVDTTFSQSTMPKGWAIRNVDERTSAGSQRHCSYTSSADQVRYSGGLARFAVRKVGAKTGTCPYGVWDNPMIKTDVSSPYGFYSARIQFGRNRGMHAAFWLKSGAEIDTVEHFGYHRPISNLLHNGYDRTENFSVGGDQAQTRALLGSATPYSAYHEYSVQWSPSGYVFRLDGVPTLVTDKKNYAVDKTTGKPYSSQVILSLQTSDYELPALDQAAVASDASTMKVDWVRAWQ